MGESETMPNPVDRGRLKDRIIESISKAVKNIQLYGSCQLGDHEQVDIVHNEDWQFCKLVEHLDHAFLHGLRHVSSGYWIVVQEFTHKSTVKEIERLVRVVTDLGRSRAWLYQALADHLLESYVRCYIDNTQLVKRYYVHDALVLDEQRLQLLLTLSSGLDLISFELEIDVPYLDLCSHQPVLRDNRNEEDVESIDDASFHSVSSSQSSLSVLLDTPTKLISKLPFRRRGSSDVQSPTVVAQHDDECSRAPAFVSISENVAGEMPSEVEVVHVRRGAKAKRRDGRIRSSRKSSDDQTVAASAAELETPESGYRSVFDDPILLNSVKADQEQHGGVVDVISTSHCDVTLHAACAPDAPAASTSYCSDRVLTADETSDRGTPVRGHDTVSLPPGDAGELPVESHLLAAASVAVESRRRTPSPRVVLSSSVRNISEDDLLKSILDDHYRSIGAHESSTEEPPANVDSSRTVASASSLKKPNELAIGRSEVSFESSCDSEVDGLPVVVEDDKKHDSCNVSVSPSLGALNSSPVSFQTLVEEEEISIYDDAGHDKRRRLSNSEEPLGVANVNKDVAMSIFDDSASDKTRDQGSSSPLRDLHPSSGSCRISRTSSGLLDSFDAGSRHSPTPSLLSSMSIDPLAHQMEIRLDNNLKLLLMLEVFQFDHEKFVKMFRTSVGHTEGDVRHIFLLITDLAIYLLSPSTNGVTKYEREAVVTYRELDFISLSLNGQVINIVCQCRQKQYWITTGDEQLTELIVESIDHGHHAKDPEAARLSILTDATMQKISFKKYVAAECRSETQDVRLLGYFLVYWEDTESLAGGELRLDSGCREGPLMCKTYNYLFGGSGVWSSAYFLLKDGMLYQYDSRNDVPSAPRSAVNLRKDDCCGCRRIRNGDRSHCFEIVFTVGSSMELAALSAADAAEWLQAICHSISNSKEPRRQRNNGCLPCCCMVTVDRVLMCHEDVQTNFIRTLNSASVASLSAVYRDHDEDAYCILAFDSTSQAKVVHQKWAIYFAATAEKDRFVTAVKSAFNQKVEKQLALEQLDTTLSKRCQQGVAKLNRRRLP